MAIHALPDRQEHGPFKAFIGTDSATYEQGQIRIEPPFVPGESFIGDGDDGIVFDHFATTDDATIIGYSIPGSTGNTEANVTNLEQLLDERLTILGGAALLENFQQQWDKF